MRPLSTCVTLIMLGAFPQAISAQASPATRPAPQAIAAAVDSFVKRAMAARVTSAFGIAIVMDGKTVYEGAFGMADATAGIRADTNTLWYIASTTKSFTGVGVSLLANEGVIDINSPITKLLPKARWHRDVKPDELTLVHFLTHTMGLSGGAVVMNAAFTGIVPEARWPELLVYSGPLPTRDLIYNNLGYNVAAMVIDAKRSQGWRRYLEESVFRPVGMNQTYHRVSGLDARRIAKPHAVGADLRFTTQPFRKTDATMNSAGGHLATLSDLARWTIVNMQDGSIDGRQVLPSAAIRQSHKQLAEHTVEASKTFGPFRRAGWSAGWDIGFYRDEPMVSRFGGYETIRSHLSYLPGRRIGVVAQTTAATGSALTDVVAAYAYDLEAGRSDALARADSGLQLVVRRLQAVPEQLRRFDSVTASRRKPLAQPIGNYAGRFEHPGYGAITFTERDGRLRYEFGAYDGPVDIYDASRNQFRIELGGSGNVVEFVLGGDGRARELALDGNTFTRCRALTSRYAELAIKP